MSADNGIYIAKFPDGYRVIHCSAIDNIDLFPEGTKERKNELKSYFGLSDIYKSISDAFMKAIELKYDIGYTEYGINYIGEFESFNT